jgi:Zn-dependent protease/predicted transcriptional regulator
MRASYKVSTILGIPIYIHISFILIIALFAWFFAVVNATIWGFPLGFGGLSIGLYWQFFLGTVVSVVLFACVLLHELGHSRVTQEYGIKIQRITLFIFGGISESEEIPKQPRKEFLIAIAGPIVSLALGAIFWILYLGTNFAFGSNIYGQIFAISFGTLSFYNITLALFNLIPAFPIDGGRVLRSALAARMEYGRATRIASTIGRAFAIGMAVFGILILNLWLVFIAIFIYLGASQEESQQRITSSLEGVKIGDLMRHDFPVVAPDMLVNDFIPFVRQHQAAEFPVVSNERLVGFVKIDDLKKVDKSRLDETRIKDIMEQKAPLVPPNDDALHSLRSLMQTNTEEVLVGSHDTLQGIVTKNDFIRFIQTQEKLNQNKEYHAQR